MEARFAFFGVFRPRLGTFAGLLALHAAAFAFFEAALLLILFAGPRLRCSGDGFLRLVGLSYRRLGLLRLLRLLSALQRFFSFKSFLGFAGFFGLACLLRTGFTRLLCTVRMRYAWASLAHWHILSALNPYPLDRFPLAPFPLVTQETTEEQSFGGFLSYSAELCLRANRAVSASAVSPDAITATASRA